MARKNLPPNSATAGVTASRAQQEILAASLDDMDMDGSGEEMMVESIEGVRVSAGNVQYWVHWANFDEKDNTWEPIENLTNCQDQLETWHRFCSGMLKSDPANSKKHSATKSMRISPVPRKKSAAAARRVIDEEAAPRQSVSSSISNDRKGRANNNNKKNGRTTGGKSITNDIATAPPMGDSDDDDFPLAQVRTSRSQSKGTHSRSASHASKNNRQEYPWKTIGSDDRDLGGVRDDNCPVPPGKNDSDEIVPASKTKKPTASKTITVRPVARGKPQAENEPESEDEQHIPHVKNSRAASSTRHKAEPPAKKIIVSAASPTKKSTGNPAPRSIKGNASAVTAAQARRHLDSTSSGDEVAQEIKLSQNMSKETSRGKDAPSTSRVQDEDMDEDEDKPKGAKAAPEQYMVECMVGALIDQKGKHWFLVKWEDYPLSECSWEEHKAVKAAQSSITKFYKAYGKPTVKKVKVMAPAGERFEKWVDSGSEGKLE